MLSIKANFNMFKRIDKKVLHTISIPNRDSDEIMLTASFNSQDGTGTHFGPAGISAELFKYKKDTNYILKYFDYVTGYNLEQDVRRFIPSDDYFKFLFNRWSYRYGRTRKTQETTFELEKSKIIDHIGMLCLYYKTQSFKEIVFLEDGYVLYARPEDMQIATDFKMRCIMKGAD